MYSILILYPHGLGDCILATPALKALRKYYHKIGFIMQKRFEGAQLFRDFPYVDEVFYCDDAWAIAGGNFELGLQMVKGQALKIKEQYGYKKLVVTTHKDRHLHKIYRNFKEFGMGEGTNKDEFDLHTIFSYKEEDIKYFYPLVEKHGIDIDSGEFIFYNGKTGLPAKDMQFEVLQKFQAENDCEELPIVSPDFTWDISKTPISFAAHLMKKAKYRVLADSGLYHIAHAMDLTVDLAYFGRGSGVWGVVRPLHNFKEIKRVYGKVD